MLVIMRCSIVSLQLKSVKSLSVHILVINQLELWSFYAMLYDFMIGLLSKCQL